MKILLGVPEYPPHHVGGGGPVYKNLAKKYKEMGHEVVVIYGYYKSEGFNDNPMVFEEDGIEFYELPEIPYPESFPFLRTALPPNIKSLFAMRKIIKQEKPDAAHLHGYGLIFVNFLSLFLNIAKVPYIFTIHGYPESQNNYPAPIKFVWDLYIKTFMNYTLRRAKKLTAVSEYIKRDERNIRQNNTQIINNAVDYNSLKVIDDSLNVRNKHNLEKDDLLIFSLGRLSEMKGFQKVIELLPDFSNYDGEVKYVIAGEDDGYKSELIKLAKENKVRDEVEFVGYLDEVDRNTYLEEADVLAVPSLWEPFGLSAVEGMFFGKVILTTEIGGLKEVLSNYNKKININSDNLIEKIKEKSGWESNFDKSKFHWDTVSEEYLGLLKTIKES